MNVINNLPLYVINPLYLSHTYTIHIVSKIFNKRFL